MTGAALQLVLRTVSEDTDACHISTIVRRLFIAAVVALASPTTSSSSTLSARIDPQHFTDAVRVRTEFGFRADEQHLAALFANDLMLGDGDWLTPAEQDEMVRRADVADRLEAATGLIKQHKEEFGGVYFDQSVGDMLLIVRTLPTTSPGLLDQLRRLIPQDAVVDYRPAEYSWAKLLSRRDEALAALPFDLATSAHVDPISNSVVLAVAQHLNSEATSIAEELGGIKVTPGALMLSDACTSRSACDSPWRGGTWLGNCTWGFVAEPDAGGSTRYAITAGHCAQLGANLSHNGVVVNIAGGVDSNSFDHIGAVLSDSLRTPLKVFSGADNLIYKNSSFPAYAITSTEPQNNQTIGEAIGMAGRASGWVIGTIVQQDLIRTVCRGGSPTVCKTIPLDRASFFSNSGDSGAPIISQTAGRGYGINHGRDQSDNRALFSTLDRMYSDMLVRICVTSAC